MAPKKQTDPDEILHLQVDAGQTVIYQDHAYGDRGTLQVPRRDLEQVDGSYTVVDPNDVPDAGAR